MKKYKYWSTYFGEWRETISKETAINAAYWAKKPYYIGMPVISGKKESIKWVLQQVPDSLDLSNTDTFHTHETKGKTRVSGE